MTAVDAPARRDASVTRDEQLITPGKLVVTLLALVVLGFGSYFGGQWWQGRKEIAIRERLEACVVVPDDVVASISARLVDVEGHEVRSWRATRSATGQVETWFVSVEILQPGLARGASGDIATWAGALEPSRGFAAVEENARQYSTWPPSADNMKVTDDAALESRYCVRMARDKKFRELPGEEVRSAVR